VPVDEVRPMTESLALWGNPNLPIIRQFGVISSLTRLFASWQAGSVALFGHNLLALRIPSAIVGTLTVGATYFLGRVLFDRKTAVIGALLLAAYPPHLQFSRIGILNIGDPLFGTLAFAFLALAFKSNRRLAWVLGGVCLGLTQYFYEGGRLLYPAFIMIWVILMLLVNRKAIGRWLHGLLIYGLTALAIAAPIYYTLARLNDPLSTRMNTLSLSANDWAALLTSPPDSPAFDFLTRHFIDPLLLFINRPDPTPYYGGSTALILVFLVPAFVLGIFWSLRHASGRGLLLLFLAAWAGNLLMVDSALAARYVVVFPVVTLLMALGIVQTAAYLLAQYRSKIVLIYVAFCLVAQTVYYFGPHLENYNQQLVQGRDAYDALFRTADLPSGTNVYLIAPPPTVTESYAQNFVAFVSDDKTIQLIDDPNSFAFSQLPLAATYTFFVPADDAETPKILTQHFALEAPEYSSYPLANDKAYVLYQTVPQS
jgi:4-amino-4-deoxy-L-arabinose transferase-like glycosyltransferase